MKFAHTTHLFRIAVHTYNCFREKQKHVFSMSKEEFKDFKDVRRYYNQDCTFLIRSFFEEIPQLEKFKLRHMSIDVNGETIPSRQDIEGNTDNYKSWLVEHNFTSDELELIVNHIGPLQALEERTFQRKDYIYTLEDILKEIEPIRNERISYKVDRMTYSKEQEETYRFLSEKLVTQLFREIPSLETFSLEVSYPPTLSTFKKINSHTPPSVFTHDQSEQFKSFLVEADIKANEYELIGQTVWLLDLSLNNSFVRCEYLRGEK